MPGKLYPVDTAINYTALVTALQRNDRDAFDALYQLHHQAVYRNICKLIPRQDVVEDLLQEVFLALWEHRATLRANKEVVSWLFVVSYNKSVTWLKKNIRESLVLQHAPVWDMTPDESQAQEELYATQLQALNQAVEQLPLRKKQAFRLCRLEGRTYEEAGNILGISAATAKEYVKSAAQLIRSQLVTVQEPSSLAAISALAILVSIP